MKVLNYPIAELFSISQRPDLPKMNFLISILQNILFLLFSYEYLSIYQYQ